MHHTIVLEANAMEALMVSISKLRTLGVRVRTDGDNSGQWRPKATLNQGCGQDDRSQ
jgi:hypothetical protein